MGRKSKIKPVPEPILRLPLIPESEVADREAKYLIRLNDFNNSADLVKRAHRDFYEQQVHRAGQEHWEHHLRCDGLPRPYLPVEVRTFISKMRFYDDVESKNSIDWTLSIDERSVLNQNIFRVDKTRPAMKVNKDNPGVHFDRNVQMCLDTLRLMDVMWDNQAEVVRMSEKRQKDVLEVTTEVELEIDDLFDRLTYRVLKMQNSYMESEDGRVAAWSYKCKPWKIDMWGLLNVPIIFDQLELPVMLAELKATGVSVQIPKSVLQDCITLRSLHTDFDNISQNAKSFETAVSGSVNYPTAGIVDIEDSVINEWQMQLELQEETLNLMLNRRREYEEMMQIIAEKTEAAAKAAKAGDENAVKVVIPKAPKEPPYVPPNMYPDIYADFLRMEDSQYLGYFDEVYHPRHLDIQPYEINLRECIMLGGIYAIMFIRRPDQTQFQKFNIILHEDGRVLHTMPEIKAQTGDFRKSKIPRMTRETYRGTKIKLEDDELPYFIVTLQLAPDLCKWSEPEVCHYISETEFVSIDSKREYVWRPTMQSSIINRSSEMSMSVLDSSIVRESRHSLESANIFRPTLRSFLRQSKIEFSQGNQIVMENFKLQKKLNNVEIRALERHGIPRIISSFRFPVDFSDAKREGVKTGAKGLVKRQEIEEATITQPKTLDFNFEAQVKHPERVFVYLPPVKHVGNPEPLDDLEPEPLDNTTALGLLKTFDDINMKYRQLPIDFLSQPDEPDKKRSQRKEVREEPEEIQEVQTVKRKSEMKKRSGSKHGRVSSDLGENFEEQWEERDVTHWTTKYIKNPEVDRERNIVTFKTDRLGLFGLAFKRYEHFPFREWSLQPSEDNPDEIILSVDTFHVRIFFYITAKGVRGYVTDLSKGYVAKPVKYLEIVEPISDFSQMRQIFIKKNINIFAENDASYYIENGYFSIKHVALEMHTYDIMALHCKLMKFYRSSWNRLASRRDIIMGMKIAKDNSDYSEVTMRITPEKTNFVNITENCSDKVNVIELTYTDTWRNISNFTDLHQAINSMVLNATEMRNKDSILLSYVTRMLKEIRLLSYS
ncbi:uncharacterized protein LOC108113926 [Drosophila eugracilis]|uniref:uncharacterized protein LOC108113926 n=1 Tax=Drosophila eugracilis TaxID=29029 RepID=UPI0007E66965|nr:uncharacterized protein LOC108113926 [Drosophila eugracilis]